MPRTMASLSLVKVETEEVAQKKDTKEEAKHNVYDRVEHVTPDSTET